MAREGSRGLDSGERDLAFEELWERERLLNAAVAQADAEGLESCTVECLCARAGVPGEAFRAHFQSVGECFEAACDSLMQQLMARTISAYHAPADSWIARVRAALSSYLRGVCARPEAARAYLLSPPNAPPAPSEPAADGDLGTAWAAPRERAIGLLEETIAEMLRDLPESEELGWVTVTGIAGGISRVVERRVREGRTDELADLLEPMLTWALMQLPEEVRPPEAEDHLLEEGERRGWELLAG
ncbi:MAG TPA: TetR/AcrR family transcriptional regulator [Solirubrobacteraceae bacterium]|nr:TetR/AcrR family transcriptional regulator [Solirubrobacteraceae bacterium]